MIAVLFPTLLTLTLSSSSPAKPLNTNDAVRKATIAILQKQCEEVMGWSWYQNENKARANLGGVISVALLESYKLDPQPSVWVTLNQYATHLRKIYLDKKITPFKADIEFLAKFAKMFNDKNAISLSKSLFERIRTISPNGRDEFKRIATARANLPQLIGYEVSLGIRAAHALNEMTYANALADATLHNNAVAIDNGNDSYQVLSAGAFLYALSILQKKSYTKTMQHLARHLEALQGNNGSWALNDTQATAYALMGLHGAKRYIESQEIINKARKWLLTSQLKDGSWGTYHDGLPEPFVGESITLVQAETLRALLSGI